MSMSTSKSRDRMDQNGQAGFDGRRTLQALERAGHPFLAAATGHGRRAISAGRRTPRSPGAVAGGRWIT
ncbi:hypothetical protein AcV5_003756 [Taiwanofungus camphoratus]|nr:hypothetical protein AcV5_003756 [Antrodia cinnamomea]